MTPGQQAELTEVLGYAREGDAWIKLHGAVLLAVDAELVTLHAQLAAESGIELGLRQIVASRMVSEIDALVSQAGGIDWSDTGSETEWSDTLTAVRACIDDILSAPVTTDATALLAVVKAAIAWNGNGETDGYKECRALEHATDALPAWLKEALG